MNVVISLWISYTLLHEVVVTASRTKLVLSRIENEVKTLRSDVNLLKYDSVEAKLMIDAMNETCYHGNKCSDPASKQSFQKTEASAEQVMSAPQTDDVARLFKAFTHEKMFYRENMDVLLESHNALTEKIEALEAENAFLNENLKKGREKTKTFIVETEDNFAKCDIQIEKLKSDTDSLNNELLSRGQKHDSEMAELRRQLKLSLTQNDNLETSFKLVEDKLQEFSVEMKQKEKLIRQCDSSWVYNKDLNSCFLFSSRKRSWSSAVSFCKSKGGRLVELKDRNKNDQVKSMFDETGYDWGDGTYSGFWAGGFSEGNVLDSFVWEESNVPFVWKNWYPHEPSYYGRSCMLVMVNDGYFRWDDQGCYHDKPFVCEKGWSDN